MLLVAKVFIIFVAYSEGHDTTTCFQPWLFITLIQAPGGLQVFKLLFYTAWCSVNAAFIDQILAYSSPGIIWTKLFQIFILFVAYTLSPASKVRHTKPSPRQVTWSLWSPILRQCRKDPVTMGYDVATQNITKWNILNTKSSTFPSSGWAMSPGTFQSFWHLAGQRYGTRSLGQSVEEPRG